MEVCDAKRHHTPGLSSKNNILSVLIKPGCNRGCRKRKIRGRHRVLEFFRHYYNKYGRIPPCIKPSEIARFLGLDHNLGVRTEIGVALSNLMERGYLERWTNGGDKVYCLRDKLYRHFERYPCLTSCEAESSLCGLIATSECPFYVGVSEDGEFVAEGGS